MAHKVRTSTRFTPVQIGWIKAMAKKLQIEEAAVHRLAITRLAQWEGVAPAPPVLEFLRELIMHEIREKQEGTDEG